jgi:hypothetical protein
LFLTKLEGGTPIGSKIEIQYLPDMLTSADIIQFMNEVDFIAHKITA